MKKFESLFIFTIGTIFKLYAQSSLDLKCLTLENNTSNEIKVSIIKVEDKIISDSLEVSTTLVAGTIIAQGETKSFLNLPPIDQNDHFRIESKINVERGAKLRTYFIYGSSLKLCKRRHFRIIDESDLRKDSVELTFVGKGNLQQALSNKDEIPANTGIGILLYKNFARSKIASFLEAELIINVASTVDTIKADRDLKNGQSYVKNAADFGNYLLIPSNSGRAGYFATKLYFKKPFIRWWDGLTFSFAGSSRVWKDSSNIINTAGFALRLGLFDEYTPFRYKYFSILYGFDLSFRGIYGDAGQKTNSEFRSKIFNGNNDPNFFGFQPYVAAKLQNLKAELAVTYLYSEQGDIPGLTGYQLVVGISYAGGFPLKITF